MFKSSISKLPILLLARNKTLFQQTIKRNLAITTPLYKEKKKQNNSGSQKKIESKKVKFQETQKKIYYKFLCRCRAGFNDFPEFLEHVKNFHQIENLNFQEILAKNTKEDWPIKFYWHLSCQCGHKFSSSLCNANLRVKTNKNMLNNNNLMIEENTPKTEKVSEIKIEKQIEILKKYKLQCVKCEKIAKFDNEKLLDEFLKDRVKQKLIYSFYWKEFAKFKSEPHKELKDHIRELCEKCQELGRHCGYYNDESSHQEQISQIHYIPPFMKR